MGSAKRNRKFDFNYDEPLQPVPGHQYPAVEEFDLNKNAGIRVRILIEKALQRFEGVNLLNLEELGVTPKDVVTYRNEIRAALYAIIKEENGYDTRLRSGAIAYLGALKFNESADIVASIALDAGENGYTRGYAVEALGRIKGEMTEMALEKLVYDPIYTVREKAVRVLGNIGSTKHLTIFKQIASNDESEEIRFRANAAMHFIETGKVLQRPDAKGTAGKGKLIKVAGGPSQIGRHGTVKPQTTFGDQSVGGGIDLVLTRELEERALEKPARPVVYELGKGLPEGITRIVLRGAGIGNAPFGSEKGNLYRVHEDEIVVEWSDTLSLRPGCSLGLKFPTDSYAYQVSNWLPEAPGSPVIFSVQAEESVIWANGVFALVIRFCIPSTEKTALLRIGIRMPGDEVRELSFALSSSEIKRGEKIIPGFLAAIPGSIDCSAALYTQNGGACKLADKLVALPANPIFMSVRPSSASANGAGPAHYNPSEDKFFCYAQLEVTNGFPHAVTIGPRVSARVSDGIKVTNNFSFSIGTSTIPANATRTFGIWLSFGGQTYNVFKQYGDVTIRLSLQTSEGDITGSGIWAAMAQVKLALTFIGNFSDTTRSQLKTLVDRNSSAIYEQQNLYISDSEIFIFPSTHRDFDRYRDIQMNDNKNSDCTSGSNEAEDLRVSWSSPNETWLDVWLVESLSGPACAATVGGFSPVNGPTDKGSSQSGVIIKMSAADLSTEGGRNLMAIIIAHEVGHYLGLRHHPDSSNLMSARTGGNNRQLTHAQYLDMAKHGFITRFVI